MRKELEQKLVGRWPRWFNLEGDVRHTLMSFGFCHGDGWFDILWRLCEDLEPLVTEVEKQTGHPFEVLQVKEKLGGLRFCVNHRRATPFAGASKQQNWSPSPPVKSAASRENGGKAVGLRPCATSMPAHTQQKSDGKKEGGHNVWISNAAALCLELRGLGRSGIHG